MATETVTPDFGTPEQRLERLKGICTLMAADIGVIRRTLQEGAEEPDTAYLACQALSRLGWIADEASVIAGHKQPMIGGNASQWLADGLLSPLAPMAPPAAA